ncbi:MAG TPA: acyltransferase [Burkholderiales bacterium]
MSPQRVRSLDGLRGVAILLVLLWHYYACEIVTTDDGILGVARQSLSLAWSGVDLFFVLSGFLIGGILIDRRESANYFRVFFMRRVCRIFPLYFLVLGLYVAVAASGALAAPSFRWLLADPLPLWSYASFTQNVAMAVYQTYGAGWLGVTWSLAIEEQFYLVLPFVVFLLPRRALALALLLGIAAAPVLQFFWPGFHAFVNAPWRADTLLSGAMLAFLVRQPAFVASMRARPDLLRALLVALSLGAVLLSAVPEAFGSLKYFWLAGLCATLLLTAYLGTEPWLVRCLESRPLVWFGQVSFAVYLLHQVVSGLVHGYLGHDQPQIRTLADAGFTLLALAITLALAALSYRWIEQPFVRYGHRFRYAPIK